MIEYSFPSVLPQNTVSFERRKVIFNYPCESENACYPYNVTFPKGFYQIECFGAGYQNSEGNHWGYGAYVKGSIHFTKKTELFLYLGAQSGKFNAISSEVVNYNGVYSCGASDLRTVYGNYDSFDSLKSRIMVAGGSGSADSCDGQYGYGGTLKGEDAVSTYNFYFDEEYPDPLIAYGGTQTKGGQCKGEGCIEGRFGNSIGKSGSSDHGGFGGGGYYSGASFDLMGNGGGGSSFISGYKGCDAIDPESNDYDSIKHTGQSIHYSGLMFFDSEMISGSKTNYTGLGKVIITILNPCLTCLHQYTPKIYLSILFFSFYLS